MPVLTELLAELRPVEVIGPLDRSVREVQFDSRRVGESDLFVAVRGTQFDGHTFIPRAFAQGAAAIVCETKPAIIPSNATVIVVPNSSHSLGLLAHAFFRYPSKSLIVIGVTGTNGKTTIATILYKLFSALGYRCGLLSTIRNYVANQIIPSTHTTGDALQIASIMAKMVDAGCRYCFMEVTSHAIDQDRISGIEFDGGIFTNLSHDHLDYHRTMDRYQDTKKRFFQDLPENAFALTNDDDEIGLYMISSTVARRITYGSKKEATFNLRIVELCQMVW